MIQGRKLFNELLVSLQEEIKETPKLSKIYELEDLDLKDIPFDEKSNNNLIELIRTLVEIYQDKKGDIKTRDINKLFS